MRIVASNVTLLLAATTSTLPLFIFRAAQQPVPHLDCVVLQQPIPPSDAASASAGAVIYAMHAGAQGQPRPAIQARQAWYRYPHQPAVWTSTQPTAASSTKPKSDPVDSGSCHGPATKARQASAAASLAHIPPRSVSCPQHQLRPRPVASPPARGGWSALAVLLLRKCTGPAAEAHIQVTCRSP